MLKQKKLFKNINKGLLVSIFALAWPTMLEQLMQTAVQYIDTAMVGSLGTKATAAVGSTTTVNWLVGSTVSALGVGFLSFIAKAYGANDKKSAARASSQAVLITVISGIFFTVLTLSLSGMVPVWMQVDKGIQSLASRYFFILYLPMLPRAATTIFGTVLRAAGDTKTPMRIGVLVNAVNVSLNFILIYPTRQLSLFSYKITVYGAGLGVTGAAIASAIAFTLGGICITAALWRHPVISPKGSNLKPDMQILRPCLKIALPNMLQRFGTSLGYVAFASMINSLGGISTASHTIANTVESAFYIPGYGMQTAAATLSGNAIGAKDKKRLKDTAKLIILIEVSLMIISGALLFIFAPVMIDIFTDDKTVLSLTTTVLRLVALSEPFYGVSIVVEGMLMGAGKTVKPFVYNIIGMWGIRIVGTFICITFFGLGLVSAWSCMILHNLLLFVLFVIYWFRGNWNPIEKTKDVLEK